MEVSLKIIYDNLKPNFRYVNPFSALTEMDKNFNKKMKEGENRFRIKESNHCWESALHTFASFLLFGAAIFTNRINSSEKTLLKLGSCYLYFIIQS